MWKTPNPPHWAQGSRWCCWLWVWSLSVAVYSLEDSFTPSNRSSSAKDSTKWFLLLCSCFCLSVCTHTYLGVCVHGCAYLHTCLCMLIVLGWLLNSCVILAQIINLTHYWENCSSEKLCRLEQSSLPTTCRCLFYSRVLLTIHKIHVLV